MKLLSVSHPHYCLFYVFLFTYCLPPSSPLSLSLSLFSLVHGSAVTAFADDLVKFGTATSATEPEIGKEEIERGREIERGVVAISLRCVF